jgi:hypothetical protein
VYREVKRPYLFPKDPDVTIVDPMSATGSSQRLCRSVSNCLLPMDILYSFLDFLFCCLTVTNHKRILFHAAFRSLTIYIIKKTLSIFRKYMRFSVLPSK